MINLIPKNLIMILLSIIALIILFSFLTFYMSIKPGKWPVHFTPKSFDLKSECIEYHSWPKDYCEDRFISHCLINKMIESGWQIYCENGGAGWQVIFGKEVGGKVIHATALYESFCVAVAIASIKAVKEESSSKDENK